MRISGTELSSVILSQKSSERVEKWCPKSVKLVNGDWDEYEVSGTSQLLELPQIHKGCHPFRYYREHIVFALDFKLLFTNRLLHLRPIKRIKPQTFAHSLRQWCQIVVHQDLLELSPIEKDSITLIT